MSRVQKGSRQSGGTFLPGTGRRNTHHNPLAMGVDRREAKVRRSKAAMRSFLEQRLKKGMVLDLSDMTKSFSGDSFNLNSKLSCDALCSLIAEDFNLVETVSLSGNSIMSLKHLVRSMEDNNLVGKIRNLDLSNNELHSMKELETLRVLRLSEVILKDNPIAHDVDYQKTVVITLPSVELVDGENVVLFRKQIQPALPPSKQPYFFGPGTQAPVFEFCKRFFQALDERKFDTDLLEAYDPQCMFTLTTHRGLEIGYGVRAKEIINNLRLASHNLLRVATATDPVKTVYTGRLATIQCLKDKVYKGIVTRHDLRSFQVDAMPMPSFAQPVVVVSIHGSCQYNVETSSNSEHRCGFKRTFDRTFVLRQAEPGTSRWPALLTNDFLHIRPLCEPSVFADDAPLAISPPSAEEARQQVLVSTLSVKTKLTEEYSRMCLEAAGWDLHKAEMLLDDRRASLPAEAWTS